MAEREGRGMKCQSAVGVCAGSVFLVAGNGMAGRGKLDAYLVLPAGIQFYFEKRQPFPLLYDIVAGDSLAAAVVVRRGAHFQ